MTSSKAALDRLERLGPSLQRAQLPALDDATDAARRAFLAAPGAPHKVAGKATTVRTRKLSASAMSTRWTGPAHLVDRPTKPHTIGPKGFVGTRGTGRKAQRGAALMSAFGLNARSNSGAVKLTDGSLRAVVHHPGTRGKNFFARGKQRAVPLAAKAYRDAIHREIGRTFKGG